MKRALVWVAVCALLYGADAETLVRRVALYEYGGDAAAVRELDDAALRASGGSGAAALEKALIAGLGDARTLAAKDAMCRALAMVGSEAAVPKLGAMLVAPDTAEMARYALERIPGARVDAALRDALKRSAPAGQTGIVVSLGRRKDAASAAAIAALLEAQDARLGAAAAEALGRIATAAAREALMRARPTPAVSDALLAVAERSNAAEAAGIYRRLAAAGGQGEAVRAAALRGWARVDASGAAQLLHEALKSDSANVYGVAIRELARQEGVALAKELPNVGERARVQILWALTDSGRPEVRAVLVEAAASSAELVRIAALGGLAKLGTAADIPMLAARAANATSDEQTAARAALGAIRGEAADAAVLQVIPGAEAKVKVELIRAVGERGMASASDVLLAAAADADRTVRVESIRALRETAGARQVPPLLGLLGKTTNASERREVERALAGAIRRSKEGAGGEVLKAYQGATDSGVRISLLNVLSAVGDADALPAIREALHDPSAEIQRAALNALTGWPTPEPMDDLLALARSRDNASRQVLALRGYIRMVQLPSNRTAGETARLLTLAMAAATRREEKSAVLAAAQRLVCLESLELARAAVGDPQVSAEAQLAATTLERGLSFLKK